MLCLLLCFRIAPSAAQSDGITERSISFGQSAAFSGPLSEIGKDLRLGIEAAFNEVNLQGGVHGRRLYLRYLDDGYEPSRAITNTRKLIGDSKVFALIGEVGTPTARAAAPIAEEAGVPFIAPFTGASFLRDRNSFKTVINLRASYQQEVLEIVERLTQDRGVSRIAVLYQDDSFGRTGYDATNYALQIYGLPLIARGVYPRNTIAVKTALVDLKTAEPEAVIVVGAYAPVAEAIRWAYQIGFKPTFVTISFVGSNALARELGSGQYDLFMTQVVPDYKSSSSEISEQYRNAVEIMWPGTVTGFSSFEGYIAGRMTIAALELCGADVDRECFLRQFQSTMEFTVGDLDLVFGEFDSQGSDDVFLTVFRPDGTFVPVRSLDDTASESW